MAVITKEQAVGIVTKATNGILSQQPAGSKQWNQREHLSMVRNAVLALVGDKQYNADAKELKASLFVVLDEASCGNASAYRQSLKNADGTKMFPASEKKLQGYE